MLIHALLEAKSLPNHYKGCDYALKKKKKKRNKDLISADCGNKATLLLTIPCSLFKSSAKDLALENLDFDQGSALEHSLLLSTL